MPSSGVAHGFAQRYDLPVPLALYLTGAAAAVALSFVVIAFLLRHDQIEKKYWRFDLFRIWPGRLLAHPVLTGLLRLLTVLALLLVIVAGLFGNTKPFENFAPTTVWVIWWVGMAYVSGLAGDLWALINPWNSIYRALEWVAGKFRPGKATSPLFRYPKWMADWPAVTLFLAFVWAELVWPSSDSPRSLGWAVLAYSLITWAGMFVFGRHAWLRHGEAFTLVFGFLSRFAPTEYRARRATLCLSCADSNGSGSHYSQTNCLECFENAGFEDRQFNIRPFAVGLVPDRPVRLSQMVLVLIMLSSVTFDGLLATPLWGSVAEWMLYSDFLRPAILLLQDPTGNAIAAISTIALVFFLVCFQILYAFFSALMRWSTPGDFRTRVSIADMARLFVLSLIPIALAYHLAHYLSFLMIVGQYMVPLLSDPLGIGWDIFGTSFYVVNIAVVNARFIWITSVIAIVTGHIAAVYLSHLMALKIFENRRAALFSQIPMLFLMVGYTMLSLWIMAQPVVETG
jgi:hypothetical protein